MQVGISGKNGVFVLSNKCPVNRWRYNQLQNHVGQLEAKNIGSGMPTMACKKASRQTSQQNFIRKVIPKVGVRPLGRMWSYCRWGGWGCSKAGMLTEVSLSVAGITWTCLTGLSTKCAAEDESSPISKENMKACNSDLRRSTSLRKDHRSNFCGIKCFSSKEASQAKF